MTKTEIEQAYNQYQPLLHKLSHQCASRCGRPEEDVYGQACWLFMQATESFNPAQGEAFRPYMQSTVHNGLIKWGRKMDLPLTLPYYDKEHSFGKPIDIVGEGNLVANGQSTSLTPDRQVIFHEWLTNLSTECREVVMIILNGPGEVLDLGMGMIVPKTVKGALRRYLRSKGWTDYRLWKTLKTLKMEVKAL
ncbi:MAG: sigma factor [Dehalococcoidales bacterium]|nr:sigma factor [Dehalococcoidales bacterium]